MATPPHPPPETGTRIVFVGSTEDQLVAVVVDEKPPALGQSGGAGFSRLTRNGKPIWVNHANVLFVEETVEPVDA
jgi:hypothetical protein